MKKIISMCIALALVAGTAACGKSDGGDAKNDAPTKDGAAKDGDAKKEPAGKGPASGPAAKKEEKKAPAADKGGMTVDKFATAAPKKFCSWIDTCKNEEITTGVQTMATLMVAFGAMAKPELAEEIKGKMEKLKVDKDDKRTKMNAEECGVISELGAKLIGLDQKTLSESVTAKRVTFDGAKAEACLKAFDNVKACSEEKKVEGKPDMKKMEEMMKPYEKELEGLTKDCEDMLVGQVAAGEACMNDYECKDGGSCKGDAPGAKEKKCAAKPAGK